MWILALCHWLESGGRSTFVACVGGFAFNTALTFPPHILMIIGVVDCADNQLVVDNSIWNSDFAVWRILLMALSNKLPSYRIDYAKWNAKINLAYRLGLHYFHARVSMSLGYFLGDIDWKHPKECASQFLKNVAFYPCQRLAVPLPLPNKWSTNILKPWRQQTTSSPQDLTYPMSISQQSINQ